MGTLLELQGKEHHPALDFGEGDIGAVAKLKDAQTGDLLDRQGGRGRGSGLRLPGAR